MTERGTTVKIHAFAFVALALAPCPAAMAHRMEIPSRVVVERRTPELSRRDVFRAIRAALVKNGFPEAGRLRPVDVQFQMPLKCTQPHPRVRVIGASFDPELQMAVFRLQTANEADVGPFDAMVRPVAGLKAWLEPADARAAEARTASFLRRAPRNSAWRVHKARAKPAVMPLQTVNLVFLAGNMEIHTTAETLEQGYLGQVIRVRMNKTRKIFRAKVVAPDYLEARF